MESNVNNQDYVCETCGNEGYKQCLVTCCSCNAHQHMYCMMEVMLEEPMGWECDDCKDKIQEIMVPPKKRRIISTGEVSSQCASLKKESTKLSQYPVMPPLDTLSCDAIRPLDTPSHDTKPSLYTLSNDAILPIYTPSYDTMAPLDTLSHDTMAPLDTSSHVTMAPLDTPSHDTMTPLDTPSHDTMATLDTLSHDAMAPLDTPSNDTKPPPLYTPAHDAMPPFNTPSHDTMAPLDSLLHDTMAPLDTPSHDTMAPLDTLSNDTKPPLYTPSHDAIPPFNTPSHDAMAPLDTPSNDTKPPPLYTPSHDAIPLFNTPSHDTLAPLDTLAHDTMAPLDAPSNDTKPPLYTLSYGAIPPFNTLSHDTMVPLDTPSHDTMVPLDTPSHDTMVPLDTPSHDTIAPLDTVSQDHATPTQDTMNDVEPTAKLASSTKRRRGRNKNFGLTKLASGEKLPLIFNSMDKKPMCQNRKLWSRHLGVSVRDNSIIKHRTLKWSLLSTTDMDHLWQTATNKFDAKDMEIYRDATLAHMKHLWYSWRSELNLNYIKPHNGDLVKIKANKPREFTQEDWEWLLTNHFLTDHFKKVSKTNAANRKNLQYVHHTGSKPFTQVEQEMVTKDGNLPTFIDVFLETHSRKDKSCINPAVQQKVDEMRIVKCENPTISNIELTETVFGVQRHGTVIGMGSISPSKLRGRRTLLEKNISLQEQIKKLTADQEALEAKRLQEKEEFDRKLAILEAQLQSDMLPNASMPFTTSTSRTNIAAPNLDDEKVDRTD